MNLKELLLQFAGENEESLKLDELIFRNNDQVSVIKNFNNGVELAVKENYEIDLIVERLDILLIENNYDSYEITKINENIIKVELV